MTTNPSALLHDLREVVERILRRFRLTEEEQKEPLYKYVSFFVFRKLVDDVGKENEKESKDEKISSRRGFELRLYDAEAMNDPLEGRFLVECSKQADKDSGSDLLAKIVDAAKRHPDVRSLSLTFIASFTRKCDDLDLWRSYCQGHGVCFRFAPPPFRDIYRIKYGEEHAADVLAELAWVLRRMTNGVLHDPRFCAQAVACLRPVLYLVKAEGHRAEDEVRLIETRDCWDDVNIDIPTEAKEGSRSYIVEKEFFFREYDPTAEVMLGPMADKFEYLRGGDLFLKEVLIGLHRNQLHEVNVNRSRHDLRY